MTLQDNRWRVATIALTGLIYLFSFFSFDRWDEECRGGDPWGYFAHLPALFIYGDVGDYSKTIAATQQVWHDSPLAMQSTPIGRQSDKYPLGVATLVVPFFLLGHGYALLSGQNPNGFNAPYALSCGLGVVFYVLCGLYVLFGLLRRYFTLPVSVLTVLALSLATNLFYFTTYNNLMAHGLLFSLYCFLLLAIHWFEDHPTWRRAIPLGICLGLITLTRLHEIIAVLIPLMWGVSSWTGLGKRFRFLYDHRTALLAASLAAAIVLFPQFAYYKYVSGQWWYYAYTGETFDFRHPRIWDGLTSFTNGWLIYTPLMVLAIIGVFRLRRLAAPALGPILAFLPLHIYITYSWWCWYYINGQGSRPMVETYALLAFPLGAFFSIRASKGWVRYALAGGVACFAWLNILQTVQIHRGIFWPENANKAYYWAMFGSLETSRNSLICYDSGEPQPTRFLIPVRTLAENPMEDSTQENRDSSLQHSGQYSVGVFGDYAGTVSLNPVSDVLAGDWIRVSVWAYQKADKGIRRPEEMALLVLEIRDTQGESIKHRSIRISSKISNTDHSIWNAGDSNQWGKADFFVRVPPGPLPVGHIKAYVWNPAREKIYVDDLTVELWRDGR